jgi:hypothetical protein
MTLPMNSKFSTTTNNYDLLADATIVDQITKHLGDGIYNSILKGNARLSFTVFVNSTTQIKFTEDDNWQDFIVDKVYSSNSVGYPKHIYIKDTGITGLLSLQVE